jgi:hypothetical protein
VIAEAAIAVLLALTGYGVLAPLHRNVPNAARVWLSFPIGAAVYLLVAFLLVLGTGSLPPTMALSVTGVIGVVGGVFAAWRKGWDRRTVGGAAVAIGLSLVTVLFARSIHLTRLTPDSLRYLLFSTDLQLDDALTEVHRADLLLRQIGLPSLHTLSSLTDLRYMASIGPLFGVFALGFFVWFLSRATRRVATWRRWALVTTAILLLGTSNRLVYDAFYINTHIEVAAYLLIAIACSWLAVTSSNWEWAVPAGMALGISLLYRPEVPLVVAVVLMAMAASRAGWAVRLTLAVPPSIVVFLWYGMTLWRHAPGGDNLSLTAPVFGSLVAVLGAFSAVALGNLPRLRAFTRHLDWIMLGGLSLLVMVLAVGEPEILVDSAYATFRNLTYDGLWLLTWPTVIVLAIVALVVHRIPDGRLWTTPIIGFALLFWLLPLILEGAYGVGAGRSGNRILAHILAVTVTFLVLATIETWPASDENGETVPR